MIDVIKRIDFRLQGRSLLSLPEQLLADARDEIVRLREHILHLEKEIKVLTAFKDDIEEK